MSICASAQPGAFRPVPWAPHLLYYSLSIFWKCDCAGTAACELTAFRGQTYMLTSQGTRKIPRVGKDADECVISTNRLNIRASPCHLKGILHSSFA